MKSLVSVIFFLSLVLPVCARGDTARDAIPEKNPLLEMVGKPFAVYHDTYIRIISELLHGDSSSRKQLVRLFDEAAAVDKSAEWGLLAGMVKNTVRFYESRNGSYTWSAEYTAEDYAGEMRELAGRAGEKGFRLIKVFSLYHAADGYSIFAQDYEHAFSCYLEAAAELETIGTEEFPPRPHIYNQIAGLYYTFMEYGEAIIYYRKVTDDPFIYKNYYNSHYPAMNGLGLCYRNGYKDYERSNWYFAQILEQTRQYENDREVWEGIAEGNIGYNYYLSGDLDTALLWLVPAIKKITRPNDFSFVSQRAVNIAEIYLKKGDPGTAKKYIDIASDYHSRTGIPEKNSDLYNILTRYYAFTGDGEAAMAYLDSTMTAVQHESERSSGLVLRRIEQQLRAADGKLHEQELDAERARSKAYMRTAVIISTALVIILILLALTLLFYRRKRNAYRELVRRSRNWAGVDVLAAPEGTEEPEGRDNAPEGRHAAEAAAGESDLLIMEGIDKAMSEKKLFKRADLTLDALAEETGFNRYYVSGALNRCTGGNFSSYVNEYRVKEAIRIMSERDGNGLTIDGIAFEAGFDNRVSFYRVFKKMTGLSPTDFRKNLD